MSQKAFSPDAGIAPESQTSNTIIFNKIVNDHLNEIYNFSRYMISDPVEAEDIVQKTFLAFYENFGKLDQSQSMRPWLYKVARNNCLDYLKKKKLLNFSAVEEQIADIPESHHTLEGQLDSQMFLEHVKKIVQTLPPDIREVMLLKYFEDFTFEQIAEFTGSPVNTVKSNFYRGKSKIYKTLEELYG